MAANEVYLRCRKVYLLLVQRDRKVAERLTNQLVAGHFSLSLTVCRNQKGVTAKVARRGPVWSTLHVHLCLKLGLAFPQEG